MNTDDLIKKLAQDVAIPDLRWAPRLCWAIFGAASLSIMMVWLLLGLNGNIPNLLGDGQFLLKMFWFLLMAGSGFMVLTKSLRPDEAPGWRFHLHGLLFMGMILVGAVDFISRGMLVDDLLGMTWSACPFLVVACSLPVLVASLYAIRVMAPANPGLAGLSAGIMSGGIGAFIYGLHCPELALPFISAWYGLGIIAMAGFGYLAGRYVLHW